MSGIKYEYRYISKYESVGAEFNENESDPKPTYVVVPETKSKLTTSEILTDIYNKEPIHYIDTITKIVGKYVMSKALKYIHETRPEEVNTPRLDEHSRHQLVYPLYILKNIARQFTEDIPNNPAQFILIRLDNKSRNYMMFKHIYDVTKNMHYVEEGEPIEENILLFISMYFELNDKKMVHFITETYINYIKRFSKTMSTFSWQSNKNTNHITTNTIIRIMDSGATNPYLFSEIYEFGNYVRRCNETKKTTNKLKTNKK